MESATTRAAEMPKGEGVAWGRELDRWRFRKTLTSPELMRLVEDIMGESTPSGFRELVVEGMVPLAAAEGVSSENSEAYNKLRQRLSKGDRLAADLAAVGVMTIKGGHLQMERNNEEPISNLNSKVLTELAQVNPNEGDKNQALFLEGVYHSATGETTLGKDMVACGKKMFVEAAKLLSGSGVKRQESWRRGPLSAQLGGVGLPLPRPGTEMQFLDEIANAVLV